MIPSRTSDDSGAGDAGKTTGPDRLGSRFRRLWSALGGNNGPAIYGVLARFYGQQHRYYHTLTHIEDCLRQFDALHAAHSTLLAPRRWNAVELALWFHDVVYEPRAHDNEERSADVLEAVAAGAMFPPRFIAAVRQLILATKNDAPYPTADGQVMLDCDLASLGYAPPLFRRSSTAIRREYAFLPNEDFAETRRTAFLRLSQRPSIFHTEFMRHRYEQQARANLADVLEGL